MVKTYIPYKPGTKFSIAQGWLGTYSHNLYGDRYALDFNAAMNTVVTSATAGEVVFAGWSPQDFGFTVIVKHADGFDLYAHGKKDSIKVYEGQKVQPGDELFTMGNTGFSDGDHLHFERFDKMYGYGRVNTYSSKPYSFEDTLNGYNLYGGAIISAANAITAINDYGSSTQTGTIGNDDLIIYRANSVGDVYLLDGGKTSQGKYLGNLNQTPILAVEDLNNNGTNDIINWDRYGTLYSADNGDLSNNRPIGSVNKNRYKFIDILKSYDGNHSLVFQDKVTGLVFKRVTFAAHGPNHNVYLGKVPPTAEIVATDFTGNGVEGLMVRRTDGSYRGHTYFWQDGNETNGEGWYQYHRPDKLTGSLSVGGNPSKDDLLYYRESTGQVFLSIDGSRDSYFQIGDMSPGETLIPLGVDTNNDGVDSIFSQTSFGELWEWTGSTQANGLRLGTGMQAWSYSAVG